MLHKVILSIGKIIRPFDLIITWLQFLRASAVAWQKVKLCYNKESQIFFLIYLRTRPVNLHPLFLFLKTWVSLWPWKKPGPKYGLQKAGRRKQAAWPLLFLNNNDPVFFTLLFSGPYLGTDFFQGHKPTHVFKTRILGADWLGNCALSSWRCSSKF